MRAKAAAGFLISVISILGINFIPLEMFLYRDFRVESAMVLYAVENILAIGFATVLILAFAPVREENADFPRREEILEDHPAFPVEKFRRRSEILASYLIFSISFSAGSVIFLTAFIYIALKSRIQFEAIAGALTWIVGFQVFEFLGAIFMLRPLTLAKTEDYLKQEMGRVALLFLSVFFGIFLALFVDSWFFFPFIFLKTIVDMGGLVRIFRTAK